MVLFMNANRILEVMTNERLYTIDGLLVRLGKSTSHKNIKAIRLALTEARTLGLIGRHISGTEVVYYKKFH